MLRLFVDEIGQIFSPCANWSLQWVEKNHSIVYLTENRVRVWPVGDNPAPISATAHADFVAAVIDLAVYCQCKINGDNANENNITLVAQTT